MFCQNCGKEIESGANFCAGCGAAVSEQPKRVTIDDSRPVMVVKPSFQPMAVLVSYAPIWGFAVFWCSLFFGGIANSFVKHANPQASPLPLFVFCGIAALIGFPSLVLFATQRAYAKSEYRIYRTRLEFFEGFWTVEEKTIEYKFITEVNLTRNIIQRQFNLGTIVLSTTATGSAAGVAKSGISLRDIKTPEYFYSKIKELIAASR